MKTYKTWEVIKMITENETLKFQNSLKEELKYSGHGIRMFESGEEIEIYAIRGDEEWTLIQEPVDFMTAVKSGKRIKVEHEAIKHFELKCTSEYLTLFVVVEELAKNLDSISLREILTEGKFYIEE